MTLNIHNGRNIGAYSLGGTMAVNLSRRHVFTIKGVISFCAPLDMTESSHRFHQPRNKLYNRHFTKSLIKHELFASDQAVSQRHG